MSNTFSMVNVKVLTYVPGPFKSKSPSIMRLVGKDSMRKVGL